MSVKSHIYCFLNFVVGRRHIGKKPRRTQLGYIGRMRFGVIDELPDGVELGFAAHREVCEAEATTSAVLASQ